MDHANVEVDIEVTIEFEPAEAIRFGESIVSQKERCAYCHGHRPISNQR